MDQPVLLRRPGFGVGDDPLDLGDPLSRWAAQCSTGCRGSVSDCVSAAMGSSWLHLGSITLIRRRLRVMPSWPIPSRSRGKPPSTRGDRGWPLDDEMPACVVPDDGDGLVRRVNAQFDLALGAADVAAILRGADDVAAHRLESESAGRGLNQEGRDLIRPSVILGDRLRAAVDEPVLLGRPGFGVGDDPLDRGDPVIAPGFLVFNGAPGRRFGLRVCLASVHPRFIPTRPC